MEKNSLGPRELVWVFLGLILYHPSMGHVKETSPQLSGILHCQAWASSVDFGDSVSRLIVSSPKTFKNSIATVKILELLEQE